MRTLIVNCSTPHYNLGAQKLAHWLRTQGDTVTWADGDPGLFAYGYDRVCLSVIFSWHARLARNIALRVKRHAEVWCGGPGMFTLGHWWCQETSLPCVRGLDPRFERQRGTYRMTFASRGCPVGCSFCIVPQLEGRAFTLDWDFSLAPVLCDNNLSALPVRFQEHIIHRYREAGLRIIDANSGFEPQTFDAACYQRWKPILRGPWRSAYDTLSEGTAVERMLHLLAAEPPRKKQVYVLIGNEPIAACYERACKVIEWGGEPFCQPFIPLNTLSRQQRKIAYDWTPSLLTDFARYFNRHLWRSVSLRDYTNRKREVPPFAALLPLRHDVSDL
jgi:pyruvate-formate lyase-activating enzyme